MIISFTINYDAMYKLYIPTNHVDIWIIGNLHYLSFIKEREYAIFEIEQHVNIIILMHFQIYQMISIKKKHNINDEIKKIRVN